MSAAVEIAAGLLLAHDPWPDRATVIAHAEASLRDLLHPSAVWQPGHLPPELRAHGAYGSQIPMWRPCDDLTHEEERVLERAWSAALPALHGDGRPRLRVRATTTDDVRRLRSLGEVDGLALAPSLDTAHPFRSLRWRWPFRVGVVAGPRTDEWLHVLHASSHHGHAYDAEVLDAAAAYDIVIVDGIVLLELPDDAAAALGDVAPCVISAGDGPVDQRLAAVQDRARPLVAAAVDAPPELWWFRFFDELAHDVPIDAATESLVRDAGVDALLAGPRWGLDVTASAHWFAAVAGDVAELAPVLEEFAGWDWRYESGGTRHLSHLVRAARDRGADPVAFVPPPAMAAPTAPRAAPRARRAAMATPGESPSTPPAGAAGEVPPQPRRLVARVLDDGVAVRSILPPHRQLDLAVRIAIPAREDVAADRPAPGLPDAPGPTVELEVAVRGAVWSEQPAPQTISVSREHPEQPSTWAVFAFTTPAAGSVVSIEIVLLFRGKPLQAATYVSPVRSSSLPGERPTLTTFTLSGPDEPDESLRPVDVTLDARGAELVRVVGGHRAARGVLITGVQGMLDKIEDRVSRVLGVPGAPDSFDDPRAVELLVTLARLGVELRRFLSPLDLADARSINLLVDASTRVLPLELAYAAPPPNLRGAKVCEHVAHPPAPGEACDRASTRIVCPYAFWGLHRSIARTVVWEQRRDRRQTRAATATATTATTATTTATSTRPSVLYGATVIADEGAVDPLPTASVFHAAESVFPPVTRVTSWTAWRKAVRASKPNLLVVLGHTMVEGGETNLYIGKRSALPRVQISPDVLRAPDGAPPIVLLIACATASLGDAFGTLPGALTAEGAGAVVATLSKITGPHGAAATTHLLRSFHQLAGTTASVGDAVAAARRSLIAERRPIGLILVAHGELDRTAA